MAEPAESVREMSKVKKRILVRADNVLVGDVLSPREDGVAPSRESGEVSGGVHFVRRNANFEGDIEIVYFSDQTGRLEIVRIVPYVRVYVTREVEKPDQVSLTSWGGEGLVVQDDYSDEGGPSEYVHLRVPEERKCYLFKAYELIDAIKTVKGMD